MKGFTWIDMVVLVVYLGQFYCRLVILKEKEMKGMNSLRGWNYTAVSYICFYICYIIKSNIVLIISR